MKILILSNYFPPHFIGGYELGCFDVVQGLKARGHEVAVLTSNHGIAGQDKSDQVYRLLETDLALKIAGSSKDLFKLYKKESTNQRAFKRVCDEFSPDVLYVWNAKHISISLALKAQERGIAVCYFVSDYWLNQWESDALYALNLHSPQRAHRRLIRKAVVGSLNLTGLLPRGSLNLSHVQFASGHLKQQALAANRPVSNSDVIHWGVDVNQFQQNGNHDHPARLLYVGQLTELKGVHTAVEALKIIVEQPSQRSTMLTIVGGPDYESRVHRLVYSLGLEKNVQFTGLIPRGKLPSVYQAHDILLFPSIWEEPFSLTLLEAMASSLAVVGTTTGGSSEILRDEVNALIFPKEDPEACAEQVLRLLKSTELRKNLGDQGRRTVEEQFRLDQMVNRIDLVLKKVA